MLCCEPVLDLATAGCAAGTVIVYPGGSAFAASMWMKTAALHEWDDELAGECWEQGPVILSLEDAIRAVDAPGIRVSRRGARDRPQADLLTAVRCAPLDDAARRRRWIADFQRAFDALRREVDAGRET